MNFDSILNTFRTSLGVLHAELKKIRDQLERARRRREELLTLPLPPEERAALWWESIQSRGRRDYEERLAVHTAVLNRNPRLTANDDIMRRVATILLGPKPGELAGPADLDVALTYFFGDQIRERLAAAFKAQKGEYGPPRAERETELPKLEKTIAELDQQEKVMLDELAKPRRT